MTLTLPCPRCKRDLPDLAIDVTTEPVDKATLSVTLNPRMNRAWLASVRLAHPWCFGGSEDIGAELAA